MPLLGAHMSIAGGYSKAVERAAEAGCDCVQLFTKNNNQWRAKPIAPPEAEAFQAALDRCGIRAPIAHDSYLINLASPDDALWRKSIDALVVELRRAEQLGLQYVVAHPGAYVHATEAFGLQRVAEALDEVHRQTPGLAVRCLLEVTAGQGTNLGWRFEHLAAILGAVREGNRLDVCLDTCHLFAAGYAFDTPREYRHVFRHFDEVIGIDRIKAIHLNDSKTPRGSRVDRHEHIGEGHIGLEAFRLLLRDPRWRDLPMYLETPKGQRDGVDLDVINLRTLRGLL